MNPERLEALLWGRIDGTISNDDLAELQAALTEHPEPSHLEREITRIAEELDDLQRVPPPAEMRDRIATALDDADAAGDAAPVVFRRRSTNRPYYWLPLAACVLIGVALGYLLPRTGRFALDESQVVGTMGTAGAPFGAPFNVDLDGGLGTVKVEPASAAATFSLDLPTDREIVFTVMCTGGELAVTELDESSAASSTLSVAGGTVVLRTRGPGSFRLGVTAGSDLAPLRIEITADGELIGNSSIDVPRSGSPT